MSIAAVGWQDRRIPSRSKPAPVRLTEEPASSESGDPTIESDANSDDAPDGVAQGLATGAHLGRYTVLRRLGAGAMGVVYSAYDPDLDRRVAIKILHPRSRAARDGGEEGKLRLLREAKALARLSHPNVVAIHDVGTIGSRVFLAMEFVDGQTLGAWLKAAPRGWREVLKTLIAAGDGLQAAHEAGLVHRDFKPENVSIGGDGRVRVLDFGLARAAASDGEYPETGPSESEERSASVDLGITSTGVMVGTPAYMSPEQHLGRAADARSDQFAFCVTLYLALYGERPFAGDNVSALQASVIQNKIRPAKAGTAVPKWVRRAILRGLAVDPDARYRSMAELLERLRDDPARRLRRRSALAAAPALLVGLAVGTFGRAPETPCEVEREGVVDIWNPEVKKRLRESYLATGFEHASQTWETAERLLDGYAESWVAMRRNACEATVIHDIVPEPVRVLRYACLERRLIELRALLDILGMPTQPVVGSTVEVIGDLTPVDACADIDALQSTTPEPTAPDARKKLEDARRHLLDARVYEETGQADSARQYAERALEIAVTLDYAPLHADALLAVAGVRDRAADHAGAKEALHEAVALAAKSGHDEGLVTALIETAHSIAQYDANKDVALTIADIADATLTRATVGARNLAARAIHRASLDVGYAYVFSHLKRHEEAKVRLQGAIAHLEEAFDRGHPTTIRARTILGIIHLELRDFDEARKVLEAALADARALTGDNPRVAAILTNLSEVERRAGNLDKALELAVRGLKVRDRVDRHRLAYSLQQLASVEDELERTDDALAHYAEALKRYDEDRIDEPSKRGELLNNLAYLEYGRDNLEGARRHFGLALETFQRTLGPEHAHTATTEGNYAEVLYKVGERALAKDHLDHAVRVLRVLPSERGDLVGTLQSVSEILLEQGDAGAAERYLDDALALLPADDPRSARPRAEVHAGLARAILARKEVTDGDRVRARDHALAARAALAQIEGGDEELAAAIENLLSTP